MGLNNMVVSYGFGQMGSAYLADGTAFTPPTGSVIVAIQCLATTTFDALTPDTSGYVDAAGSVGSVAYIGTTAVVGGNGTGADAVATTYAFTKGTSLFGRWTGLELGSGQVIMHFAPAV
tara:strand:+ start:255 stop:611 length:357 start_codon:yes stop_codon:yes gene_type:complete